jgi:hypothetical protein
MKTRMLWVLIPLIVGNLAGSVCARPEGGLLLLAQGREVPDLGPQMLIEFRGNLLRVKIHNAPWNQVVKELTQRTGVTIHVMGPLDGTMSQEFEALALEEGLVRLFGEANFVFSAAREGRPETGASQAIQVWLYPKTGGGQAHSPSPGLMATAPAEAPDDRVQLQAMAPGEAESNAPAEEAVIPEELPGTEILVHDEAPASEVEILGEEQPEIAP